MVVLRSRWSARQRGSEAVVGSIAAIYCWRGAGVGGAQLGAVAPERVDGSGWRAGVCIQKGAEAAILHVCCRFKGVRKASTRIMRLLLHD